ncbi:hypothetical protein [Candidatus Poriferisodalis sp.]|uniref:hypothetical protein n=1 Tax=Candidatus Poriferisodalis sp. TaxID=3101277 RepID=UPI003D0A9612
MTPHVHAGTQAVADERREPALIDLSEEWGFTFELLEETQAWRERSVHEILLRDSDHVDATAACQIRIPLELVSRYAPGAQVGDRLRLLLPFAVRPKSLLLNVGLAGADGSPASLVLKRDSAQIQAGYMSHVDGRPLEEQPLGGSLWAGVSNYTSWAWREHYVGPEKRARRLRWLGWGRGWRADALASYLNADLELGINARHVTDWLGQTEDARIALVDALQEGEDPESSSEWILLAVPFMPIRPHGIADIDILVAEFCNAVDSMSPRARRFLAELGRRWHVIIDTVVPVDRPCTVKLSEQRPWRDAPSPYLRQEIEVGDATTTHVEIRASDHGIVLDRLRVDDFAGERVDVKVSDDARETADAIALYADASTAPGIVGVGLRARLRRGYWRPIWWLQLLITMAGATMLWLPGTFAHLVESLALLTFPLTLAGAVVLTRESTSLAERLLRRSRTLLMASIAALWAVALGRLLLHAEVGWAESAWAWVRDTISWMG